MQLGDFAGDHHVAIRAEHLDDVFQSFEHAVRRFVEDLRARRGADALEQRAALAAFGGRKPLKRNESVGRPLATRADRNAEAPGIGTTGTWCRMASVISRNPGSEIPGMPASVTSAIFAPPFQIDDEFGGLASSRCARDS